nr:TPA_asm: hypothetical protein [Astyanax tetra cavefish adintovirus]
MECLSNAPKKPFPAMSRTTIKLSELDKTQVWRLVDGTYFGFVFDEDSPYVTLFNSETGKVVDASDRVAVHYKSWTIFSGHCKSMTHHVKMFCMDENPSFSAVMEPWRPSIREEDPHFLKVYARRGEDGEFVICLSKLCCRKRTSDGKRVYKDAHVKVRWRDWKELYDDWVRNIDRLIDEMEKIKGLERLKMRLNDYFECNISHPFTDKVVGVDIDLVYVKEVKGGVRVLTRPQMTQHINPMVIESQASSSPGAASTTSEK